MKKHLLSIISAAVLGSLSMNAQFADKGNPTVDKSNPRDLCATISPNLTWENRFQELIQDYIAKNQSLYTVKGSGDNEVNAPTLTIPVIFHIIHNNQAVGVGYNLAQAQINSQITVLNQDFAGVGAYSSSYPATAFQTYATNAGLTALSKDGSGRVKIANCYVQFCLATKDTLGNNLPEPGIERLNIVTKGWTNPNSFSNNAAFKAYMDGTIKPASIWNVKKYLNIWVSDISSSIGLLGYATFPPLTGLPGLTGTGTNTTDGIWCYSPCIGSNNIYAAGFYLANYDKGRTATHEIGHWLGLRHIWGDNGQCGATDYCVDTPPQRGGTPAPAGCNFGFPTYPFQANSCTRPDGYNNANVTNVNGDMFMNFMDYVDHVAMYMFTWDQQTRIQTSMTNSPYRNQLGTHGLCTIPSTLCVANYTLNTGCAGVANTPTNLTTGAPVPNYTWAVTPSGGVTFNPNANASTPAITFPTAGTYTVTLNANNGSLSSFSNTVLINPIPTISITNSVQSVCANGSVSINATGGTTYTWSSGGGTAATATYVVVAFSTYTVTGMVAGCTNTAVATVSTKSLPVVSITGNSVICLGQPVTLNVSGANSYTWQPGGTNGTSATYTPGGTLTYTVNATDVNGCDGSGTKTVFVNPCTGILQTVIDDFYSVYPNPTTGKLNIQIPGNKSAQLINVEVYDIIGKVILKQSLVYNTGETVNSININSLPAGSYFLKLSSIDGVTAKPIRIIKSN